MWHTLSCPHPQAILRHGIRIQEGEEGVLLNPVGAAEERQVSGVVSGAILDVSGNFNSAVVPTYLCLSAL